MSDPLQLLLLHHSGVTFPERLHQFSTGNKAHGAPKTPDAVELNGGNFKQQDTGSGYPLHVAIPMVKGCAEIIAHEHFLPVSLYTLKRPEKEEK